MCDTDTYLAIAIYIYIYIYTLLISDVVIPLKFTLLVYIKLTVVRVIIFGYYNFSVSAIHIKKYVTVALRPIMSSLIAS